MIRKSANHLREVKETYFEHLAFALQIAWLMLSGGILITFHALIPGIFVRSGSDRINRLSRKIRERQSQPAGLDFEI